jgi:T5SS/PEP-CTERM-associated repeat protein
MATATWLGGLSSHTDPNDATDPLNWNGGYIPLPGDTVVMASGSAATGVTLDLFGSSGSPQSVQNIIFQIGGSYDTINFTDVQIAGSTLNAGSGAAAGQGFTFNFLGDGAGAATIDTSSLTAGDYAVLNFSTATLGNSNIALGNHGTLSATDVANGSANLGISAGTNAVLSFTDSQIDNVSISLGDNSTLDLTGTTASSQQFTANNGDSNIFLTGTGSAMSIMATGTVNSDANIWFNDPGGNLNINIGTLDANTNGFLELGSAMINVGGTVTVGNSGNNANRFSNNGFVLVYSGPAAAQDTLVARMNGIGGQFDLLGTHGSTLDVATNMPGGQYINFGDGNGLLKIENTLLSSAFKVGATFTTAQQNFYGRITGFQPGDTIDLVGAYASGLTFSYGNDANYGNGVLIINNGTTPVAKLRIGGDFVAGSGTIGGANSTAFLVTQSGTDVLVTLAGTQVVSGVGTITTSPAVWAGVTTGGTVDWSDTTMWSGGTGASGLPGDYQNVAIGLTSAEADSIIASNGNITNYHLTITTAETAGSINFDDPAARVLVAAALTSQSLPAGQGGGGTAIVGAGKMDITAAGTVTAKHFSLGSQANLTIEAGGHLALGGGQSFAPGGGLSALEVANYLESDGGTIAAGGEIAIGASSTGNMLVSNNFTSPGTYGTSGSSVSATYTQIGGIAFAGAQSTRSSLTIQGPNTTYTDAGGDATTTMSGAMLVGGGNLGMNGLGQPSFQGNGSGSLTIQDGATLTDAAFAVIGASSGSDGMVNLNNGATWNIAPGGVVPTASITAGNTIVGTTTLWSSYMPWLTVGMHGTALLNVNSSVVQLGTGEAFNRLKVMIGGGGTNDPGSGAGTVNVQGSGALLDAGGGPMVVGMRSNGVLNISNGGTVLVGAASATTQLSFGLAIGQAGTSGSTFAGTVSLNNGVLVDDGDLVIGHNNSSTLELSNGSRATVSGNVYMNGLMVLNNGTTATAPALWVGGNTLGTLDVFSIGSGSTVTTGGTFDMMTAGATVTVNGALAVGTTAAVDGRMLVASGAVVQGIGTIDVFTASNLLQNDGTIIAGGLQVTNFGTLTTLAGTLDINAVLGGSGTYLIGGGSAIQLENTAISTATFDFGVANIGQSTVQTIRAVNPSAFQGTVETMYGLHDLVDFLGVGSPTLLTYTANANPVTGGTVSVSTGAGTLTFHVTGYHPGGFAAASDGAGGTVVHANDAAPCFVAGTLILTAGGYRPVEALRAGDLVPTALGGRLRRVIWAGHTVIDLDRHADPDKVAPVRIAAGAFGPGMPVRDLLVSPDHGIWTGTALVPAYLLANGTTVTRLRARGRVAYHHIELDAHDVLIAEGLPAESYLETGNRGLFAESPGERPLHPDLTADLSARAWDARACAPLALGGEAVAAALAHLRARSTELGWSFGHEADVFLKTEAGPLAPLASRPDVLVVDLPPGVASLRLVSRHVIASEADPASDDHRRLGAALTAVLLDGESLDLDGALCGRGFHRAERVGGATLRWTDGEGVLRLPPRTGISLLELRFLPGLLAYPGRSDEVRRAATAG